MMVSIRASFVFLCVFFSRDSAPPPPPPPPNLKKNKIVLSLTMLTPNISSLDAPLERNASLWIIQVSERVFYF